MAYGFKPDFVTGGVYHLYNRGVAKEDICRQEEDYHRFLATIAFYLEMVPERRLSLTSGDDRSEILISEPVKPLVEILAYCLMSNHFHLIVRQLVEGGVSTFMRRALNSYTRAFNARHRRVGPVFQGVYQGVAVETDKQLLHVTRYAHLNGYVARLVEDPVAYRWSSLRDYLDQQSSRLCHPELVLAIAGSVAEYRAFVYDYASYARDLRAIKDLLLDPND